MRSLQSVCSPLLPTTSCSSFTHCLLHRLMSSMSFASLLRCRPQQLVLRPHPVPQRPHPSATHQHGHSNCCIPFVSPLCLAAGSSSWFFGSIQFPSPCIPLLPINTVVVLAVLLCFTPFPCCRLQQLVLRLHPVPQRLQQPQRPRPSGGQRQRGRGGQRP